MSPDTFADLVNQMQLALSGIFAGAAMLGVSVGYLVGRSHPAGRRPR